MDSSIEELQEFIISISHPNENQLQRKIPVVLTHRERVLINLIKEGKRIAEIGEHLNLHIKTVYQVRQSLIKKWDAVVQLTYCVPYTATCSKTGWQKVISVIDITFKCTATDI